MIEIRPERPNDEPAIRDVNEAAFGRPQEADLVDALRAAGKAVASLVAADGDEIVGHILFSPVTLDDGAGHCVGASHCVGAVGLAPMAVVPERQKSGVGSRLVKAGLAACRAAGAERCVVLGHPGYYPRFGFVPASRFGVGSTYDAPDEAFMAQELVPGAFDGVRGTARFADEFDGVD